jgi:hypothetical protein
MSHIILPADPVRVFKAGTYLVGVKVGLLVELSIVGLMVDPGKLALLEPNLLES